MSVEKLLTRDEFRNGIFTRDKNECVVCNDKGQDAHHIIERRLWSDGGYYLSNGVSLCGPCHIKAETTEYSPEFLREKAGIKQKLMPTQYYNDDVIDKWGNYILPNNQRLKGELFEDESVQKIIKDYLHLFTKYVKYPRTYHLPWSPGLSKDDIILADMSQFDGKEVVVTEKMDGENTTLYNDYYHARSVNSEHHVSQSRAKAEWAKFAWDIPEGWRLVCENVFAQHSIIYNNLPAFLLGLSVWNDKNICLGWDDTVEWFKLLNIPTPQMFLRTNKLTEKNLRDIENKLDFNICEGYVVRIVESFHYSQFRKSIAKFVRKDHVQSKHWKNTIIKPNSLR